ncbi:MAG TPA: redox-sensing transcriptional repressor Rex [Actinomycetota bacterium]
MVRERPIPEATVGRLPLYLRALIDLASTGDATVSSDDLAEAAGVTSAKVRKDLSYLGSYGTRGIGYDVAYLVQQIRRELGLTEDQAVAIAGVGNLGQALANYKGFADRGFRLVALVDADPDKVGDRIDGLEIHHVNDLPALVKAHGIAIGIVATPAAAAQEVVDRMVAAGIRSILNFAPAIVVVPAGVSVRKVDLAIELQILAYYEQRRGELGQVKATRAASR